MSRSATLKTLAFFGTLLLVLSHTQMVVRAQQVTIQAPNAGNSTTTSSAMTPQQLASILSTLFNQMGDNLESKYGNASSIIIPANVTGSFRTALEKVIQQQQALGINPGQNVVESVAAFLDLPSTLGTGSNLKLFQERVKQFRTLLKSVQAIIPAEQYLAIRRDVDAAAQLALGFVAAFPLAELTYAVALVALASAIISLTASIFYVVGSSLLLSANVAGLAAAGPGDGPGRSTVEDEKWFKALKTQASAIADPVLRFAFSSRSTAALDTADILLGLGQTTFANLPALPAPIDLSAIPGPFQLTVDGMRASLRG